MNRPTPLPDNTATDILPPMTSLNRITRDPDVMGGRPCIRGLRVTIGMVLGLLSAGHDEAEVLAAYPYLEGEDIRQALAYAARRMEDQEIRRLRH